MNRVQRESYEKNMQKRLEGLYGRVEQVQDYVDEQSSQEAEPELEQHLQSLEEASTESRARWEALKQAQQEDWDTARKDMDAAANRLEQAVSDAGAYIENNHDHSLGWTEGFTDKEVHDSAGWPEGSGEIDRNSEGWPEGSGKVDRNSEGWEEGFDGEEEEETT